MGVERVKKVEMEAPWNIYDFSRTLWRNKCPFYEFAGGGDGGGKDISDESPRPFSHPQIEARVIHYPPERREEKKKPIWLETRNADTPDGIPKGFSSTASLSIIFFLHTFVGGTVPEHLQFSTFFLLASTRITPNHQGEAGFGAKKNPNELLQKTFCTAAGPKTASRRENV